MGDDKYSKSYSSGRATEERDYKRDISGRLSEEKDSKRDTSSREGSGRTADADASSSKNRVVVKIGMVGDAQVLLPKFRYFFF